MKIKLAALLISQAFAAIDKTNYAQHLCDANLFKQTSAEGANVASEGEKGMISQQYQYYCHARAEYEQAVQDNTGYRQSIGVVRPCVGNKTPMITTKACVEQKGMLLAKSCETLKQHKANKQSSWNELMPTLESCNNARRR
jgi:hypothetical protein